MRKVVVDVKVTSTADLNNAFKEKSGKYRKRTIKETRGKKVAKAVIVLPPPSSPMTVLSIWTP